MLIVKIMVAVYIWLVFPVLAGSMWLKPEEKINDRWLFTYLLGIISEWTVFFVLVKWSIIREVPLHTLSSRWPLLLLILTIPLFGMLIKRKQLRVPHWNTGTKEYFLMFAILVLLIIISIGCVPSNQREDTVESVAMMYATDTLYEYDASTGRDKETMISREKEQLMEDAKSPIEAYYAVNSYLCKLYPAKYIRILLPCFLLPFFFSVYQLWANFLYPENRGKRILFTVTVWLLCGTALISERAVMFDIFKNSWNGETLFFMGLVPLTVWLILTEKRMMYQRFLQYAVCVLAGQLLYSNGAFVISFIWGAVLLAEAVKRWKAEN